MNLATHKKNIYTIFFAYQSTGQWHNQHIIYLLAALKAWGRGPSISLNFKESLSTIFAVMTQKVFAEFVFVRVSAPRLWGQ